MVHRIPCSATLQEPHNHTGIAAASLREMTKWRLARARIRLCVCYAKLPLALRTRDHHHRVRVSKYGHTLGKCCQSPPPTQHILYSPNGPYRCDGRGHRNRSTERAAPRAKKFPFSVELGTSSLVNVLQFCGPRALHILRYTADIEERGV